MSGPKTAVRGTFSGGVHPPEHKGLSADATIEPLPTPATVSLPVLQHVGAPCEPLVKNRDAVEAGQTVASSEAFISSPVHTPICGTVTMSRAITLPNGRHVTTVCVKAGEEQPTEGKALVEDVLGGEWPLSGLESYAADDIVSAVKQAGIVGQGGAAFPTFVKLLRNDEKPIDTLLVNGCECEPYLTADYRVMVEFPEAVLCGAMLAARAAGAKRVAIAVEDNKPLAIDTLRKVAAGTDVEIIQLHTKYPQGGEKQTVLAALGRTIPAGGLPLDVGAVVVNIGTAAAIARAVVRGKALTHRVVTVTGEGIERPCNVLAPVGVTYGELIEFAGGLKPECVLVLAGGPMMGFSLGDLSTPITKGTSGVVALTAEDIESAEETHCVRCGKCVDVCPMNLVPTRLALGSRNRNWELLDRYHIKSCIECGCCAYTCPAALPLVQLIRMGKIYKPKE